MSDICFFIDRLDQLQPWSTFIFSTTFFSTTAFQCLVFDHPESIEHKFFQENHAETWPQFMQVSQSSLRCSDWATNSAPFLGLEHLRFPGLPQWLLGTMSKLLAHQQLSAHVTVATPVITYKFLMSLNKLHEVPFCFFPLL